MKTSFPALSSMGSITSMRRGMKKLIRPLIFMLTKYSLRYHMIYIYLNETGFTKANVSTENIAMSKAHNFYSFSA